MRCVGGVQAATAAQSRARIAARAASPTEQRHHIGELEWLRGWGQVGHERLVDGQSVQEIACGEDDPWAGGVEGTREDVESG